MRVLVTGSEGFIGSHIVTALRTRGDRVAGADRRTGQFLELSSHATRAVEKAAPDLIIHLASSCSTPGSVASPMDTFNDTVLAAVNILEAARLRNVPIHITSSVKARDGMTPYGAAKRMVETWALEYRSAYGLPVVINRPGTVYGPGQEGSTESGWIAWFLEAKRRGLKVVVNGDGNQWRDLLHVSDYVRLVLTQLDDFKRYDTGEPWDVGGGYRNAVTVNEIVQHLGLDVTYGPPRYGDARSYVGINQVPGWKPEVDWEKSEALAQ
jgi:nucleoside-diphosphate-sugar epimerase